MKQNIRFFLFANLVLTQISLSQWFQTTNFANTGIWSFAVSGTSLFAGTSAGVILTSNDETTWSSVSTGLPKDNFGRLNVHALAVSGTNLFAGTDSGVFLSTNNGTNWTSAKAGLTYPSVSALAITPDGTGGTNLFAGTLGGPFISTNAGTSWTAANTGIPSVNIIFSLAEIGSTNLFAGTSDFGVYLSTNNGTSWTAANNGLISVSGISAVYALTVSDTILFAGTNAGAYRSTDKGTSWSAINTGLPIGVQVSSLAVSPNGAGSTNLFAGTGGAGVFLSTNNGTSWTSINSRSASFTVVSAFAVTGTNLFAAIGNPVGSIWRIPLSYFSALSPPILNSPTSGSLNQALSPVLYWSGDSNAYNYRLQFSRDSSFTSIDYDDSTITTNSKRVGPLQSDTIYYWRVKGFNLGGSSGWSATFHFMTRKILSPNLISPADGSVNQPLSPTLSWTAGVYPSAYHLQVAADSMFSSTLFNDSSITVTSKQTNSLLSNTKYYWRVATIDSGNISSWSPSWHFVTLVLPPTGIIANSGNRKIELNWQASLTPNVFRYKIYRTTSSPASTLYDSTTFTAYSDSSLSNGQQYFYRITGENSQFVEGPFSSEVTGKPFNQAPHATGLNNVYQPNSGTVLSVPVTFSSSGSYDSDGTVDSVFWYVDGKLESQQAQFTRNFAQGTASVMLVVEDNQGGKDTSFATVSRSMFKVALNGPVFAGPSLLGTNVLYVISTNDAVYRMDAAGNVLYSLNVGGEIRSSSSIAFDTTVYIASSDNDLYAFSKFGISLWPALPLGGTMTSTPAVDSITNCIYVGVSNKNFFAVNRKNGNVVWNYFVDAPIVGSAAITLDRKLVVATVKGTIYGFDLSTISSSPVPSWQISLSDSIFGSPAIDAGGNIYYCTGNGKVDKIIMPPNQQASIAWQSQVGGTIAGSAVIDGNGTIYVGCGDAKLYAIDIQSGNIKWSYPTSAPVFSTPAVSNANIIYFANHGGEVFAIDTNKVLQWYYQDSTSVDAPLLYNNGVLYVGTIGGRLMAFYDGADSTVHGSSTSPGLSKVGSATRVPVWGTFQGNNQRTGLPVGKLVTSVHDANIHIPEKYDLLQNYPNPFNPSTTLRYGLPTRSRVRLLVYNVLGQVVASLVNAEQAAGWNQALWNANVASGLYFYRLEAVSVSDPSKRFVEVKKMILLK